MKLNPDDLRVIIFFLVIILTTAAGFYLDYRARNGKSSGRSKKGFRIASHVVFGIDAAACVCSIVFLYLL